jgi:hypothetical protein
MAKKRKAAAKKASRKPAPRRRRRSQNPDATINTLVILVVIVVVLAGMYLYAQNRKQAALLPIIGHAIATLITPQPALTPPALLPLPAAGAEKPDIAIVLKTTDTVEAK